MRLGILLSLSINEVLMKIAFYPLWLLSISLLLLNACSGGGGGRGNNLNPSLSDGGGDTYVKSYSTPGFHLTPLASAPAPDNGHTIAALRSDNSRSIVIASLDRAGDVRWAQSSELAIPSTFPLVSIEDLVEATDGNIWAVGPGRTDDDDEVLVKLSSEGNLIQTIPLPAEYHAADIDAAPDGGFVLAGSVNGRLWVRRGNADGTTNFEINRTGQSGPSEYASSITMNADGSFVISGSRDLELWLARYNAQGGEIFNEGNGDYYIARDAIFLPQSGGNVNHAGIVAAANQIVRSLRDRFGGFVYANAADGDELQTVELSDLGTRAGDHISIIPGADANEFWLGCSRVRRLCSEDTDSACYVWDNALQRYRRDANDDEFRLVSDAYFGELPNNSRHATSFRGMIRDTAGNPIVSFMNDARILVMQKRSAANPSTVLWQNQMPRYFGDEKNSLVLTQDNGILVSKGNYLMRLNADGTTRWAQSYYPQRPSRVMLTPSAEGVALLLISNAEGSIYRAFNETGGILFSRYLPGDEGIGLIPIDGNNDGTIGDELVLITDTDSGTNLIRVNAATGDAVSRSFFSGHLPVEAVQTAQGFFVRTSLGILNFSSRGELASFWQINGFPIYGVRSAVTADGNIYLVNRTVQRPIQVLALGTGGQVRWHRSYTVNQFVSNQFEEFLNASATPDGGLIVNQTLVDTSTRAVCSDPDKCGDGVAFKIDSNGNLQWNKVYGTARLDSFESALGTNDNGGILFGRTNGFAYPTNTLLAARLDADGNVGESCVANAPYQADITVSLIQSQTLSVTNPLSSSPASLAVPAIQADTPESEPVEIITARACSGSSQAPVVTVSVSGPGRVNSTPNGISCSGGSSDCTQAFTTGTTVTLQAVPNANSRLREWGGDCAQFGNSASITVPIAASMNCRAEFGNGNVPPPTYTPPTYTPPTGPCSNVTPGNGSNGAACRNGGDCATFGYCATDCTCTVPEFEAPCQNQIPGNGGNDQPCRDNWDCDNPAAPGTEGMCNLVDCLCNVS